MAIQFKDDYLRVALADLSDQALNRVEPTDAAKDLALNPTDIRAR